MRARSAGFTMIELMVVIGIVAILSLMLIPGYQDKLIRDQIVEALSERGIDVEYIVADDEGHGFAKPENRMRAYRAMEKFFALHLGGRAEA